MSVFNNKEVKPMSVLLSEPFMKDSNFSRSVILIVEIIDGVVGFVLNDPLNGYHVSSVMEDWEGDNFDLLIGGPVERNTLHFIHKYPQLEGAVPLTQGLWWGGSFEQLKEWNKLGKLEANKIKFFLGYSGWSIDQLNNELENENWIVLPLSFNLFNLQTHDLWQKVLAEQGGDYKKISKYPIDPQLN